MKKLNWIITLALCFIFVSCTENERARSFGGKQEIGLNPGEVLVNITWKDNDMWVLTKDTTTGISYFRESSSFGIWEGEITIKP